MGGRLPRSPRRARARDRSSPPTRPRRRPRCAPARTSSTRPSSPTAGGWGRRTSSSGSPTGATRSSTRSSRGTRGPRTCSSSASTPSRSRASPGARRSQMHVVAGTGERETFRPEDFAAYYRRVRERFRAVVEDGRTTTYPYPVQHCGLCEFLPRCKEQWEHDDHLTLVAGVSRLQHDRLLAGGIRTMEALGAAPPGTRVSKIRPDTFARLRHQAELQLHRRHTGEHKFELLPQEPERGFALLPEPSPGRHLARLRRASVVRAGARARVPLRLDRAGRGRSAELQVPLGARSRRREAGARAARRLPGRAPPPLPRPARLPLRAVRAERAHAARGRARHARGGGRRPPPRRGARRPLPRHAAGAARVGAELLDQGGGGALRVRAERRRLGRHRVG